MEAPSLQHRSHLARQGLLERTREPFRFWHHSSEATRTATAAVTKRLEVYLRAGSMGGKALAIDEPVLTPRGWTRIGALRVGESVISRDGMTCRIVGFFPQGRLPVLRLTFSDGSFSRCSNDHLWVVRDRNARYRGGKERVVLASDLFVPKRRIQSLAVPSVEPVDLPPSDLALSPYLVGFLLGDGSLCSTSPRFTFADDVGLLHGELPAGCSIVKYDDIEYRIVGSGDGVNQVQRALRRLDMLDKRAWQKKVPHMYMVGSIEQRKELLAGLMDTDGTISDKSRMEYYSTSEELANQVADLVRMLGGRASVKTRLEPRYEYRGETRTGRACWRVAIRTPFNPFRLLRKATRWVPGKHRWEQKLVRIEPDGEAECVCIAVDHPSKTYVTRGGLVTHNTAWGSALGTAFSLRLPELNGIALPRIRKKRITGVVLCLDYPQQKLSVQPAYLKALGDWPYKPRWRGDGILGSLLVKPINGTDDTSTWSEITFLSQANLKSGTGARGVDWVHGDEPPVHRVWDQFRKAAHAGEEIYLWITATPLIRSQYQWLREEYEAKHEGREYHGRIELRLRSLYFDPVTGERKSDNSALTPRDLERLEYAYEKNEMRHALWAGDYVDVENDNPYDRAALLRMRSEWCVAPEPWEVQVRRETERQDGLKMQRARASVDVWVPPRHGLRADITIDPSRGINSKNHDPGAIIATDEGTGELLAMYVGYLGSYGLGRLAAIMARQYGEGWVDFENNGGYGEGVARGLAAAGYTKVRRQKVELEKGRWETRLGWTTTARSRGSGISAIQDWIAAFDEGQPYAICRSTKLIDCLSDMLIDGNGKPVAAAGMHDELQTVWGQRLRNRAAAKATVEEQRAREAGQRSKAEERRRPGEDAPLEGEMTIARLAKIQTQPRRAPHRRNAWTGRLERPGG